MKKIINGKMYDTDTAKHVGSEQSNCGESDFNYFYEELYLKKTGEFFLFGQGGPMSKYATEVDSNSWGSGKCIIALTLGEAQEWGENALSGDEYEELFGKVEE